MIEKKAWAKINIFLDVLAKRTDGFHDVDMIMTPLMLHDLLNFSIIETPKIILELENFSEPITINDNLVYKAAILLQQTYNVSQGAKIILTKNIPVAAGMAGGSSDAAATLQGLNELWQLNLSVEELLPLAANLGSDVPYCLYHQTLRAQGTGTKLTKVSSMPQCQVVLLKPLEYGISTAFAYKQLSTALMPHYSIDLMLSALSAQNLPAITEAMGNTFEKTTYLRHPKLLVAKKFLEKSVGPTLLSGSGPTLFAIALKPQNLAKVRLYAKENGYQCIITETKK